MSYAREYGEEDDSKYLQDQSDFLVRSTGSNGRRSTEVSVMYSSRVDMRLIMFSMHGSFCLY